MEVKEELLFLHLPELSVSLFLSLFLFLALSRFIFLNCPCLRHLELKAMPGEMRPYYLHVDVLSYLPHLKRLKFAYLQVSDGIVASSRFYRRMSVGP